MRSVSLAAAVLAMAALSWNLAAPRRIEAQNATLAIAAPANPVQQRLDMSVAVRSYGATGTLFHVPPGKRLIIETITLASASEYQNDLHGVTLTTWSGGQATSHHLTAQYHSDYRYSATLPVRFYSEGGRSVSLEVSRYTPYGGFVVSATVSGYLEDAP